MKALDSLNALQDLCASQRGLFTTAQAEGLGVGKMDVSRLAKNGHVERLARGVYRASAAPSTREEDVYAAWLALSPKVPAFERRRDGAGFTASLNTAAWLLGLGELDAWPLTFSYPGRRQSRSGGVRFLRRELPDSDVAVVGGIPATTARRTVLDLIDAGEDLGLAASVLRDAEAAGLCGDVSGEVNARAARCGFPEGFDLYSYMEGLG